MQNAKSMPLPCRLPATVLMLLVLVSLGACTSKSYSDGNVRPIEGVYYGRVLEVEEVAVSESLKPIPGSIDVGPAQQLTITLDTGKILVLVQNFDVYFAKGDRVRIIHMDNGQAHAQVVQTQ